jgi:putative DNA primase/helicase
MRTGQVSNIVALDLDSQDAITEALRRGLPDDTSEVKIRRGWHWYFNAPDEPLQGRDLFSGAELKAENVYVVAPP